MDKSFSFEPTPLVNPTTSSSGILVVGGGVIGLVNAWLMLDRGYHVTIIAKDWASHTKDQRLTSQIAGALWEYPPAVCGQHTDPISLCHSRKWCMVAYKIWEAIAADPDLSLACGVRMKSSVFFFPKRVEEDPDQFRKMEEIRKSGIRGFKRSPTLIEKHNVSREYGVVDAYEHLAPIIDTDRAMSWLMNLVRSKGARLITEKINGDLFDCEKELRKRYNVDIIVNASGLAGYNLANDKSCYPTRGGLIRLINDGKRFPKIDSALSISADVGDREIVFIIPRNDNILLLGGITEPHKWELDLDLSSPIISRMRKRCESFLPALRNASIDQEYPFAQGLRPFRQRNVRVERELREHRSYSCDAYPASKEVSSPGTIKSHIIHSYGHGGAGWSLSFGCALDVASLVEEVLAGSAP